MIIAAKDATSISIPHLRFLVEEPSMKEFLEGLLPRYLPGETLLLML